jgi:hypothetical protein
MSRDNPLRGAPRIHGELLKLGIDIAQSTVAKYMVHRRGPPSLRWRAFLRDHAAHIAAIERPSAYSSAIRWSRPSGFPPSQGSPSAATFAISLRCPGMICDLRASAYDARTVLSQLNMARARRWGCYAQAHRVALRLGPFG